MPELQKLHEEYWGRGVEILAVNLGEGPKRIREFIERRGYTFRVVEDRNSDIGKIFGVTSIPVQVVVGMDGCVEWIQVGLQAKEDGGTATAARQIGSRRPPPRGGRNVSSGMSVIRTENLGKTYRGGTVALRGLDLEVGEAEVFGFLGPNGAGKSTTIQLLLNFIRPSAGSAYLFDHPVTSTRARRKLGYLPESVNLHSYYSGQRLLEFYGGLAGISSADRSRTAAELLERVGIEDAAEQTISKYSKGMLQRLGLAQALLNDPDLLILDEPTSNLDAIARRDFRDVLLQLKSNGKTVFICSHILSEVESVCDRVAILQQGRLNRVGTLEELSAAKGSRIVVTELPARAGRGIVRYCSSHYGDARDSYH